MAQSPSPPLTTFLTISTTYSTTTTLLTPVVPTSNSFPTIIPTMSIPATSSSFPSTITSGTTSFTITNVVGTAHTTIDFDTTVFSAIVVIPTTDAMGQSETLTIWSDISSFSVATTSSASGSESQTTRQSPSITTSPSSSSPPSSTSSPTPPAKKAVPWAPIIVVLALVIIIPILWFIRRLVMKKRGGPSGRRGDSEAPRPIISAPIFLHQTSSSLPSSHPSPPTRSPPPRPSRPPSLRESTIEDMQMVPMLTPVTHLPDAIPETSEVEDDRPVSFRPDPLRIYRDGTTNAPIRGDPIGSPQSEVWRPKSSMYSGSYDGHPDTNNTYIPYRGPDSPAARPPRGSSPFPSGPSQNRSPPKTGVHNETLRKLEQGEENARPDTGAMVSDGEEDAKSEGSYDWAAARAQKLLVEKRKNRESPPIPEKSPLRAPRRP
ncbi:hypothetical protein L207DRAFT_564266 [Hyaloscypha variabilis F]|uniref:Uncharacterized protein n=1 Tax=Hyaloscypha variabilis (strain UAMH 11265 / GT02V1 / F) TaxID=1149755 RepID=A0A2J6RYM7_HYAVF|nr:hypothetical protein L207DRAFT_564266 [Hyaloscypha variabilis F]